MIGIKIYTKKFIPQLRAWKDGLPEKDITLVPECSRICVFEIKGDFYNDLTELFERLAIESNAAMTGADAMRCAVKEKMTRYRHIIDKQLRLYFKTASDMSIEGFLHFRLWEYSHIINVLLYSYVKEWLLGYKYLFCSD